MISRCSCFFALAFSLLGVIACDGGGVTVGTGGQDRDDSLPSGDGPDETPVDPTPAELVASQITLTLDEFVPGIAKGQYIAVSHEDDDGDDDDDENSNNGQGNDSSNNGNGNGNSAGGNNGSNNGNSNGQNASASPESVYELRLSGAWLQVTAMSFDVDATIVCAAAPDSAAEFEVPGCFENRIDFEGAWELDLLNGSFDPFVAAWLLPTATYQRLRIDLDTSLENNVTLVGVLLDDAGLEQPFLIDVAVSGSIKLKREVPLVISAAGGEIAVEFSRSLWFADVAENLAACAASSKAVYSNDGVLLITETQGAGPCNKVRGNLKSNFVSAATFK